ncbi:hypothetical protein [Deinococcus sp. QL22]|uniref:hypothetical protein n=1 Tax=Deinococcus sp. QL22 TaxID=2939437 RepID=UPI0020177B70|nr:hypothetical protein [Deinococcus sp. QL22]UQN06300.1 hypothetical protein M1R55_15795 [Deinococcus sp. QL22]
MTTTRDRPRPRPEPVREPAPDANGQPVPEAGKPRQRPTREQGQRREVLRES